jgi:hypothetical protein
MSLVYPERKWIKERKHDTEKPKLNPVKQISISIWSTTKFCETLASSSAHVSDDVIRLLTEARMRVMTFAHKTQAFQVLDSTLYGVLMRRPRFELRFRWAHATLKVILKVYHDFKHTMVPPNVCGAFRALGLEFDTRRGPSGLLLDEVKLWERGIRQELWCVHFPLDQLSGRRTAPWFNWINKPE